MAVPNIENGQYMRILIEDPLVPGSYSNIAHTTSAEMTWSAETRDVSNKDLGGWSAVKRGRKSSEVSGEYLHSYDTAAGQLQIKKLFEYWDTGQNLTVQFVGVDGAESGTDGGRFYWEGDYIFVDLNLSGTDQENVTSTYTLQNVGACTLKDNYIP